MTTPTPSPARSGRRAAIASTALGVVLALVAAVFVGRALVRDRREIGDALDGASAGWLALAAVLAVVGMTAIAVPWRRAIQLLGDDMPTGQVIRRYYVGEIGKYVPGGVWPVLGRGELAVRWGIRRTTAYTSVLLSLMALYLAAMFVVVAGLPALLSGNGTGPIAVLLLLPLGLVALHPRALGAAIALVERLTKRDVHLEIPSWGSSVALVARYVPAWLAIGGATWAVARSLDPSAGVIEIGTAATLSWLIGFLLVPVPGGVGVREAAFVAAAGSLDPGIAAAVAVAARIIFVAVDALGAAIGSGLLRIPARADGPLL
ncbi:MAG: lysylphosphatidylglycerol synthase domain-containing protein [Acidimicrobiales bacterium]